MEHEREIARYVAWYSSLVRLYPATFRDRFGQEMEQLFRDRLRDQVEDGRSLPGHAAWMFAETFLGLALEQASSSLNRHRNVIRLALATLAILLVPAVAMQMTDEVVWAVADFVFAGSAVFGTGLAYELLARRGSGAYRAAMALALGSALLLVWINGAVGLIGSEGDDINTLYYGVVAVGLLGTALARLKPRGMARTLMAMTLAHGAVGACALATGRHYGSILEGIEIAGVTGMFAAPFLISAWLFRHVARGRSAAGT